MTMFCDCGNPEAHRGEHIPKPVTDTPLDLDAMEAAHRPVPTHGPLGDYCDACVKPYPCEPVALVAALRKAEERRALTDRVYADRDKAEAQVAAVLALHQRAPFLPTYRPDGCTECSGDWPCATARAAGAS